MTDQRADTEEHLHRRLRNGAAVQKFIQQETGGRILYDRAMDRAQDAWIQFMELSAADPDWERKARELHAKVQYPKMLLQDVDQVFAEASSAEKTLRDNAEFERDATYGD